MLQCMQSKNYFDENRYDIKGKNLKTQEKYYAIDIGLRYYMLGKSSGRDMGHILENVVYLELLRRGYEVYIGKYDDLDADFEGIKKINVLDWLLE